MKRSLEHQVVLLSVQPQLDSSSQQRLGALVQDASLDNLLDLARSHGVAPLMLKRLNRVSPAPAAGLSRLGQEAEALARHAQARARQLTRLIQILQRGGVRGIPVKGPVLADQLYHDVLLRSSADLDLVVPENDRRRALEIFEKQGYRPILQAATPEASRRFFTRPGYADFLDDEITLGRSGSGPCIELQWRFIPRAMRFDAEAGFWDCLVPYEFLGHRIETLDPESLTVFTCVQSSKQGWERLIRVVDLAWLLHRHPQLNWSRTRAMAAQGNGLRMLRLGLALVERLLQPSSEPVKSSLQRAQQELGRDVQAGRLAGEVMHRFFSSFKMPSRSPASTLRFRMRCREYRRDGLALALRYLVRPTAAEAVTVPLPTDWLPAYVPVRWARLLARSLAGLVKAGGNSGM